MITVEDFSVNCIKFPPCNSQENFYLQFYSLSVNIGMKKLHFTSVVLVPQITFSLVLV